MQGPVRFDERREREATELRVLQYRTDYINGTPIRDINASVSLNATLDQKLVLVDVAYVNESESALDFPDNYTRDDIWPSKLVFKYYYSSIFLTVLLFVDLIPSRWCCR